MEKSTEQIIADIHVRQIERHAAHYIGNWRKFAELFKAAGRQR